LGILVARAAPDQATLRGIVRDANTMPDEVQYWEIQDQDNQRVTILGPKDLPIIAWLRGAKGARVVITVERDTTPVSSAEPRGREATDHVAAMP
jgi:hypothetical protein